MTESRVVVLAALCTLALTACGGGSTGEQAPGDGSPAASTSGAPAGSPTTGSDSGADGVCATALCDHVAHPTGLDALDTTSASFSRRRWSTPRGTRT